MSFRIVKYVSEYQEAVVDLWHICNLVVPWNDPVEDIQKKLDFQPDLLYIALLDNEVIGSVMAGYDGHRGWLNYLAVLPKYQKKGYGRKIVAKALTELKNWLFESKRTSATW